MLSVLKYVKFGVFSSLKLDTLYVYIKLFIKDIKHENQKCFTKEVDGDNDFSTSNCAGDSDTASIIINESEAEAEEAKKFLEDVRVTFPQVC